MRIWDINPGYLNRQSLLGEHRELHAIVSIIVNQKKGYAKHPETVRWMEYGWALKMRHKQLACEMALRGYKDKSPVFIEFNMGQWPSVFIDHPGEQIRMLKKKYVDKEEGRIPLPKNVQQLWSHHKYSVMARDQALYRKLGRDIAKSNIEFDELAMLLVNTLRIKPTENGIRNALQHMWGYVSDSCTERQADLITDWPLAKLLSEIQKRAMANSVSYLTSSTALGELMVWL